MIFDGDKNQVAQYSLLAIHQNNELQVAQLEWKPELKVYANEYDKVVRFDSDRLDDAMTVIVEEIQ